MKVAVTVVRPLITQYAGRLMTEGPDTAIETNVNAAPEEGVVVVNDGPVMKRKYQHI